MNPEDYNVGDASELPDDVLEACQRMVYILAEVAEKHDFKHAGDALLTVVNKFITVAVHPEQEEDFIRIFADGLRLYAQLRRKH